MSGSSLDSSTMEGAVEQHGSAGGADRAIPRHRLLTRLQDSTAPVIVISAAAGAGKSTLARQWAQADPRPHVLVALAPHLDDVAALGHLVIDGLEPLGAPAAHTRAVLTGAEPALSTVVLPALAEVVSSRQEPFVLVIDDVHLLHSASCHRLLAALCDSVPSGSAIALLTRDATPAWLGRTRADGRLTELTDLRLDREEAGLLFAAQHVPLDDADLSLALEQSEGWAVGLYLAALARSSGVRDSSAGDFRRFVSDYLQSQIIDALDPVQQDFLLRTSLLGELDPGLCAAVTGRADAEAILDDLHRRIQLVVTVRADPPLFRYHHLFAECLTAKLHAVDPAAVPQLHEKAAQWCADNGDLDRAIRHAKASGDLTLVGALVWSRIISCIGSGRPDRLGSWLSDLDDRQLERDPWLSLAASWLALQQGDGGRMQRWALVAERHAGRDWRARAATDPYAASLATILVLIGQSLSDVVTLAGDALEGLPADSGFRPPTSWLRGVAQTLLGQLDEGRASILQAERLAIALDVPVIQADSLAFLGVLSILGGERDAGLRQITEAVELIEKHDLDRLATTAHTVTAQAFALAVVGDRRQALEAFAKARRLTGMVTDIAPWFAVTGRLIQARTAMLLGDGATARTLTSEAAQLMSADLRGTLVQSMLEETTDALRTMTTQVGPTAALTTAELRILQFLPTHMSFPQIGEQLFLSQNTVKTHALSIYRKFAVTSRGEAVLRAQALGLVEPAVHN